MKLSGVLPLFLVGLLVIGGVLSWKTDMDSEVEKKSIVNGYNAYGVYSFYVLILMCDLANVDLCSMCGGSLIRDKTVLTAAHCVHSDRRMYIKSGDFTQPKGVGLPKEEIDVVDTLVHPNYQYGVVESKYDIALLYLAHRTSYGKPIRLCTKFEYSKFPINVVGLGQLTGYDETQKPRVLQQVQLEEVDASYCDGIDENIQFCLIGDNGRKGSCMGDSGGPVFPEKRGLCLYGAVSFGSKTCDSYSVYTKVPAFTDWINQNA